MNGICKKHGYPLNVFGGCLKCDAEKVSTENEMNEEKQLSGDPDEMTIEQIIPFLEEHGQHYTCDHNSNFGQSICSRAIWFLQDLQAQLAKLQWIKITDETMPKEEQEVIATNGTEWYKMKMFMGKLSFSGSHLFDATFTHYILLPPLPKEKSDE